MSDESHFIAAMAATPDDDTPRLVFADWLDEHGEPDRAELIRLQCRPVSDDETEERIEELFRTNREEWEAPFRSIEADVQFRRGFPDYLKVDIQRLAENLLILGLAPEWHLVLTREDGGEAPRVKACFWLGVSAFASRIRGLNFAWAHWRLPELETILNPIVVQNLRELRFGDDDQRRDTLHLLLQRRELRLAVLGFGGDSNEGLGDVGCRLLATAPQFASLRGLELPNNEIGPVGISALANSPYLTELRDLDLAGGSNATNRIGIEGARSLAGSDNLHHLTSLNLVFNDIRDSGFIALVESPRLPEMEMLNVPGNGITDDGIRSLARSEAVPKLTWLNVCGTRHGAGISAAGIHELVASPRMSRFTGLKLAANRIGDAGAYALAGTPHSLNLRELLVAGCGIGIDGFLRMLESPHLAGVREFAMSENELSANDVRTLKERYGDRVK